jgi:hypothetical protein
MFVENMTKRNAARKALFLGRLKILAAQMPEGSRKRMLETRILEWEKIPPEEWTRYFVIFLILIVIATIGFLAYEFWARRKGVIF